MKTTLLRAGALSCALLASTSLTTPAMAQAAPPPVNRLVDENGVDLIQRRFEMSQTLVSIGPDWPHGLTYVRSRNNNEWVSNFTGGVYQSANKVTVSAGTSSAVFTYSGGLSLNNAGTFSPDVADGSTLTRSGGVFTYTGPNGEVARLTAEMVNGRITAGTGRLIDLRYPNGTLVTVNYRTESVCDESGLNCTAHFRPQSITNNFNYQLHFGYAENDTVTEENAGTWHQLTSVRAINTAVESCDPYADSCSLTGNWPVATIAWSDVDYAETVTLPDGNAWRYAMTGAQIAGIRRPGSTTDAVTLSYDSFMQVQSITGANGTWTYAYTPGSGGTGTTTASGPLSGSRTVVADMNKLLVTSDTDSLGRTTSYQYDSNDRLTRVTRPEGNYVSYTYDGRGNITEERYVAKSGSGLPDMVATATYSSTCSNQLVCNQPNSVIDTRGFTTDFTYSTTHGGVLTVTAPAPVTSGVRPQTRYGYTSSTVGGQTVYLPSSAAACQTLSSCAAGADETVTTVSYTGSNFLPTSTTSGNGTGTLTSTIAITYDDIGNPITRDGPLSGSADTARARYNALRQIVGVVGSDPDGGGTLKHRATRITYDAAGLPSAVEAGTVDSQSDGDWALMTVLDRSETDRDTLGRPIAERLTSGGTTYTLTQTSYDARGRVDCVAQRMNPAEFATPPSSACTLDTQGSFGPDRIAQTNYDAAGQITKVETGLGVSGVAADEMSYTYRSNGQVETVADANGNLTTNVYDGHDRLSRTRMPHPSTTGTSSTTDYEELTYATATVGGNTVATPLVSSLRTRDGNSIGYSYDNLGRLTSKDPPGSELTITYGYDLLNRLTSAATSAHSLGFTYDALGRQLTETNPVHTVTSTYDAGGRRLSVEANGHYYIGYSYLVTGEMSALLNSSSTPVYLFDYDQAGRRTTTTGFDSTSSTRSYDNIGRLTGLALDLPSTANDVAFGYTYNPAGEIASNSRSNDAYSFTGHSNTNLASTVNGRNQLTAVGATSVSHDDNGNISSIGGVANYSYDSENRLTGAFGTTLSYDPLGRLYEVSNSTSTRRYLYDGDLLFGEYNTSGYPLMFYAHGPGVDEPVMWFDYSALQFGTLHADERGSVVARVGPSSTAINRYDEYGNAQGTLAGRFGYTGQVWMPEVGMYHYRARAYSPALGRFLQTDPIGFEGGMNLYAYVGNNPVNFIDPLGLQVTVTGNRCSSCHDAPDLGGGQLWNLPRSAPAVSLRNPNERPYSGRCDNFDCSDFTVTARRPTHAIPGGIFTSAQACLRSCHGNPIGFEWRYSTEEENAALSETANEIIVTAIPGAIAGRIIGRFAIRGREVVIGRGRIAPFGNRTGHPTGRWPHYHRARRDSNGNVLPGQGIKRHRPWDTRNNDRSFWDRF